MSKFQIVVIAICFLLNMLDGFDVLVMAFTVHRISDEWGLSGTFKGMLFSFGLFGMAVGAIFLGRLADTYGRRKLIIVCLSIITLGMVLSSLATGFYQLLALRVLTGIGIGGALASINIIAAEFSSSKRRGVCISMTQIGYPIGGMIAGVIAVLLIPEAGWRSVFVFGAFLSAIMIPIVLWRLPESIDYLISTQPVNALQRINSLLARMGHKAISVLPDPEPGVTKLKASVRSLWTAEYRGATILMWLGFFMVMAGVYFVLSWTPNLLMLAGLSEEQGISGGLILHIGGITGQLALGFLSVKFNLKKLTGTYMFLSAVVMCLFAFFSNDLDLAMYLAAFVGFFLLGSITGLYILSPALYPAEIRTTAMGWAIGIGRIGAILSPFITGVLLDLGWGTSSLFFVFAIPMMIAMFAMLLIRTD